MSGEPTWEGQAERECGEHRPTIDRAWCFDCTEWCYPDAPCARCELPSLRADRDHWKARAEAAEAVLRGLVDLKDGPRDDAYHVTRDDQWAIARDLLAAVDALPAEETPTP